MDFFFLAFYFLLFFKRSLSEYNCFTITVLVSVVQQSESAICIHISPYPLPLASPSHPPIPPLQVFAKHGAELPVLCCCFPLANYFTFGSVCMSVDFDGPGFQSNLPFMSAITMYQYLIFLNMDCLITCLDTVEANLCGCLKLK